MTKEELKAILVKRIAPKRRVALVWSDVTAAVGAATQADKDELVQHIRDGNARLLGDRLLALVAARVKTQSEAEADTILADDSLTLTELERIL